MDTAASIAALTHFGIAQSFLIGSSQGERVGNVLGRVSLNGSGLGDARWAAEVGVFNPAFDVTPASLVTAWVTERGAWSPARIPPAT